MFHWKQIACLAASADRFRKPPAAAKGRSSGDTALPVSLQEASELKHHLPVLGALSGGHTQAAPGSFKERACPGPTLEAVLQLLWG